MRIKFFIRDLKIEGVQVVTVRLAKILAQHGHEIEILTLFDDQHLEVPTNIQVTSLFANQSAKNLKKEYLSIFRQWYQQHYSSFDWLIASHGETSKVISRFDDRKCIQYIHNSDEYTYGKKSIARKWRYRYKQRKLLKNKHVLCVSDSIHHFMANEVNAKALSINTLYNPFDIEFIKKQAQESIRPIADQYIIFVGRLSIQKRVDRLLRAFSFIKDKSIKLVIMGEGEEEPFLRCLTQELNLQDRVQFHPFVKNPFPYIHNARMLLLTSDHEGLPTVIIEALTCQTTVVSTDCPSGPNEIMTNGFEKGLVDSYCPEKIANTIDQMLEEKPHHRNEYDEVIQRFSETVVYERLISLLSSWEDGIVMENNNNNNAK